MRAQRVEVHMCGSAKKNAIVPPHPIPCDVCQRKESHMCARAKERHHPHPM